MPTGESLRAPAVSRPKAGAANKYSIDIIIDSHFSSKVYTTGSSICGKAVVKPNKDVAFNHFDIVFTGIAATRLDFVQQYPSHSFRPFLKLRMPIGRDDIPEDRVFKAGEVYTVPFNFVVPHQLTYGACTHNCESDCVRDHHLRLPPSVGFWGADDQAPEMAQVEYAVKARAVVTQPGAPATKVLEGHHMLKVLPAFPEDAPLDITFRDERYTASKTKTIRKSLFSSKTGKITATATQPGALMLSPDGHRATTSNARITVEYVPDSADTAPPKVTSVSSKILATTYFGAAPLDHLPNLGARTAYHSSPCLNYTTTTNLSTLPTDKLSWKQEKISFSRRDSGYSSSHLEVDLSAKKKPSSPVKHTTTIEVPFTIVNTIKKFFLPTFHSCLISRTYALQLVLSVGASNTTMTLTVPVQIGVDGDLVPQDGELPSFETAIAQSEEEEANQYLRPRIFRNRSDEPQTNTLLPSYDELRHRRRASASAAA